MTLDPKRAHEARLSLRVHTPPAVTLPNCPPDLDALRKGAPFAWDNPYLDVRSWAFQVETRGLPEALAALIEPLRGTPKVDDVVAAAKCAERFALDEGLSTDVQWACNLIAARLRFVAAFMGHYTSTCLALHATMVAAAAVHDDAVLILMLTTVAVLREVGHLQVADAFDPKKDADIARLRAAVVPDMERDAGNIEFWRELRLADAQAAKGEVRDDTGFDPRDSDDRANRVVANLLDEPEASAGVIVFPAGIVEAVGKADNAREVKRLLSKGLGAPLPLRPVPADWTAWEAGLVAEAPWHAPAVRAIRAGQGGRPHWGLSVTCLVGAPGSGKSRLVRQAAEVSNLPFARFSLDSTSDNSIGGTPIRWSSGHPGVVDGLLARSGTANGLVLLDELDKAAGSRTSGGHPFDILHGLFEAETARAWRSPYLLAELDLSHVTYVCTANSLDGIPASLLDRMTVVRVDEPGPEHLGLLAPALARQACRELGLDERWGDLDGEELSALADAWRGGSVRRLQRLVARILQARDAAPVARH
ncbi:AAA family ATPase [Methylobacterium sp. J-067]|uniref:AAA family ATPase n=1 Tax=Methylobacterium sp. J-067 TaxID=2836648 RepID=UPI001FBB5131|nr:AAA family ATPase [Methylobacterium sp. J-067]MCJ2025580.1 AAA family ATPase [Methylobacterium sp. J-067]